MSFNIGDRVSVSYAGPDRQQLQDDGVEVDFTGTLHDGPRHGMWQVDADTASPPDNDGDPYWYVWESEMEPLAA